MINDILDFSKAGAGKLVLENIDFSLVDAVESAADLIAWKAREKGLSLTCFVDPAIPDTLRGDPGRLRQVLLNLIGNAVKFTRQGEVSIRVTPETRSPNSLVVRCEVSDTGIGVAPGAENRIFEPFTQADSSTTRQYGGTGLGLAIARNLITLMNGRIGVANNPAGGSIFWFTARFECQEPSAPRPETDFSPARMLVAGGSATGRENIKQYLTFWGASADEATDAADALAALERQAAAGTPYDVAILDLLTPGLTALDLAGTIKTNPALTATKLVGINTLVLPDQCAAFLNAGFTACLTKPVHRRRLFNTLDETLRKSRQRPASFLETPSIPHGYAKRILLVEDNPVNQKMLLLLLNKLGLTADIAANGKLAVAAVEQTDYDLILMDCQMPEMDGFEAAAAIRRTERSTGKHIPIIAMTANILEEAHDSCSAAGMDDYLSKPVDLKMLQAVISNWLYPARQ